MNIRNSPLKMGLEPAEVEIRDGFRIALTFLGEKQRHPLFVSDLSHVFKGIVQAKDLSDLSREGLNTPAVPGDVTLENGILIVRLTPTECFLMALGGTNPDPESRRFAEMTDAAASFALIGPQCLEVLSKLSPVDLNAPYRPVPCAAQAPVEDLKCLLVRLSGRGNVPGLIFSIDRGYGHFLLDAVLDAGGEFGVCIGGWRRFEDWLNLKT